MIVERPSPNHGARLGHGGVALLILHYTGMPTAAAALARLCDPAAEVSAHYTIDEDGTVYRHVPEDRRAWHAGRSIWRGETDINSRSIGIELVNPGHEFGYRRFPAAQMAALIPLALGLLSRHPAIRPEGVLGHSDVAWSRKTDPGELFDWKGLATAGIGAWPCPIEADDRPADRAELARLLAAYGYGIDGERDCGPVLAAFQRHFHPETVTGEPDRETVRRLRALVRAIAR